MFSVYIYYCLGCFVRNWLNLQWKADILQQYFMELTVMSFNSSASEWNGVFGKWEESIRNETYMGCKADEWFDIELQYNE